MYFCPSSRQKLCINIYYIDFILYYIYMIVYMGIIIYVFLYV